MVFVIQIYVKGKISLKKKTLATLGLTVGLLSVVGFAQAGTSATNYSVIVDKFNGDGFTSSQTKATADARGSLNSGIVGGDYTVDARMTASSGTGSWVQKVDDGETRGLPNTINKGISAKVQFSTNLTTPVDVKVTGSWQSN